MSNLFCLVCLACFRSLRDNFSSSYNVSILIKDFAILVDGIPDQISGVTLSDLRKFIPISILDSTIFFNFGGPGLEARAGLIEQAEQLLTITEGKYDLVAFDPR